MRKVKVDGLTYELHTDTKQYYDYYWLKGEVYEHAPIDTEVIGYIIQNKSVIGICKRVSAAMKPVAYTIIGVLSAFVLVIGAFVFTRNYDVVKWNRFENQDDVIGALDDGVVEVSKKFSYSQYAVYDGSVLSLFYDTDKPVDIAVDVEGVRTEFLTSDIGYKQPIILDLAPEDILNGNLIVRDGENISEYPIVIERLVTSEPVILALGNESDRIEALQEFEGIIQQGKPEESVSVQDGNLNISTVTDDNVNVDFASFEVFTYKGELDDE